MNRRRLLPTYHYEDESNNLFDRHNAIMGYYLTENGNTSITAGWGVSDYIEVKPNSIYTIYSENKGSLGVAQYCTYDANKTFIATYNRNTTTIVTNNDTKYLRISFRDTETNIQVRKIVQSSEDIKVKLKKSAGKDLRDYKVYGNSKQGLPDGYTQLEYIQGDGNSYISTGVIPSNDTDIELDFMVGTYTDSNIALAGVFAAGGNCYVLRRGGDGVLFFFYGDAQTSSQSIGLSQDTSYKVEIKCANKTAKLYLNGTYYSSYDHTSTVDLPTGDSNKAIAILGQQQSSSVARFGYDKIYRFKIYEKGVMIRDFVPARNSSNAVGMYDLVNGVFYTNDGTGTFIAGNAVFPTPDNPIEVESVGDKTINIVPGFWSQYPTDAGMEQYKFPVKAGTIYSIDFAGASNAYKTIWLYDTNNNKTQLVNYAYVGTSYNKMAVKPQQDGYLTLGYTNSNSKVICAEGLYYTLSTAQRNNLDNNQFTSGVSGGSIPYEPYGYKIPVSINGYNLFDEEWEIGNIDVSTGQNTSSSAYVRGKNYYKVKPNTTYYIKGSAPESYRLFYYDNNKSFISAPSLIKNATFTTPNNCEYLRIKYYSPTIILYDGTCINVSDSSINGKYEPYYNETTNIYLDEPLRKIGDYADYIDFRNKKVVRNIYEFNYSDKILVRSPSIYRIFTNCIRFGNNINYLRIPYAKISSPMYCNYFKNDPGFLKDDETIMCHTTNGTSFYISILKERINYLDTDTDEELIDKFENYIINEKNVTIGYILAEATEETINLPNIPTPKWTGIISVDTLTQPSQANYQYYKSGK